MAFLSFARRTPTAEPVPAADATGAVYRLDTIGQVCPFPLVEAKRAINPLDSGDQLQIDFDCTQATDSIPAWAAASGHAITEFTQLDAATWRITVQKG